MSVGESKLKPYLTVFVFGAVALVWALLILYHGGGLPHVAGEQYKITASIPSGTALAPGSRVTVAGVQVGSVASVERDGAGARIGLEIEDEDVIPLPADSEVQVRQHTPVGENYIAITAGSSEEELESGAALPVEQSNEFVDVDTLLSTFKGESRERMRATIQAVGGAFEGRGRELNELVGGASEFLVDSGELVEVLHKDREAASRLVAQLGEVAAAIGRRDSAINTIGDRGLEALGAVRDNDDALRETIELLPETLSRVRSTSATVGEVTAVAKPVADNAALALSELGPAISSLQGGADATRALMAQLEPTAPRLTTTLKEVSALSEPLPQALPELDQTICETAPILRYSKPYVPEMLHILMGLGASSNSYDTTGHLIRLAPIFSENSLSGAPPEYKEAVSDLLYGGVIGDSGANVNLNPYPEVGDLGTSVADSNYPFTAAEVAESGYVYPRIEADC